jgi:hypothetical protein
VDDFISAQPDLLVSATAMPSSPLDLSATPSGNTLRIVWNVATPALSDAVCGSLSIADSRDEWTVRLSSSELRRGHYSYGATSGVVDVRMDIFTGDGRLLTGTLRYIDGSKPAPYAPAAARFAVPLDSAETGENAETSKYKLCANPPAPAPGRTPRWIAAAKPLHSPTFNLPARLPLEEKTIVIAEEVLLDEEGLVVDVKTPNPGRYGSFAAELAQQLRQWKFKPATQDRVPVATTVKLEFSLRSRI